MAEEPTSPADDEKNDTKSTSRPTSARSHLRKQSKSKRKLDEMASVNLLMSGLKTEKERLLVKQMTGFIKKINSKDSEIKSLQSAKKQLEIKIDKLESTNKKSRAAVYKEQKMRTGAVSDQQRIKAAMQKIQKAVSARLKLLGIDFENITSIGEALDASLKAINSLVAQLSEKDEQIAKMEQEMSKMKNQIAKQKKKIESLEDKVKKQKDIINEQKKKLKIQDEKIKSLEDANKSLNDENASLKDNLDKIQKEFAKFKKETQEKFDEMAKKILAQKEEAVQKDSRIDELLKRISNLEKENADQAQVISDQSARIKELEAMLKDRDEKLAEKNKLIETITNDKNSEIDELKQEIERLLAIINKPKESTLVQTDISGAIDQQLSDYPRLLKEIVALKQLLEKKNQRIKDLEEENRILMLDLTYLLKRSVGFYNDRSSHTGQVWNLRASPKRYLVATGSTDMSVRIWKINPDADKSQGQKTTQVIKTARIDGKVDSLCWSKDGSQLAVGTGYRDGADGFVVVWSMDGKTQYEVLHAIRSRPTLRFGRTYGLCFSPNGEYVYCGDTVGSIWCINLESERIVGLIQSHTDIVYDLITDPKGISLYSVSCDQSLAVIVLPELCGGNKSAHNAYLQQLQSDELGDGDDEKSSDNKNKNKLKSITKDVKPKTPRRSNKKDKSRKSTKNRDKHLRNRTSSKVKNETQEEAKKYSSMTLKELLDQEHDDEYKTYEGITLVKDEKYAYWRVAMSSNGEYIVCATRKVQIFKITGNTKIEKGPNVSDMDMEHVRSLRINKGFVLTTRAGCPRAKLYDILEGKESKVVKCKKAVAQADFLYDNSYCAVLQQELVPNQAPKSPSMRLFQYNKDAKSVEIPSTPKTPKTPSYKNKTPRTPKTSKNPKK